MDGKIIIVEGIAIRHTYMIGTRIIIMERTRRIISYV
jgi:hypothetical protein